MISAAGSPISSPFCRSFSDAAWRSRLMLPSPAVVAWKPPPLRVDV
jgi:hypothetical protein